MPDSIRVQRYQLQQVDEIDLNGFHDKFLPLLLLSG